MLITACQYTIGMHKILQTLGAFAVFFAVFFAGALSEYDTGARLRSWRSPVVLRPEYAALAEINKFCCF